MCNIHRVIIGRGIISNILIYSGYVEGLIGLEEYSHATIIF